ncbi:hypothetical protein [Leuconostoc mesenteroides]|uniref:hypothetical protein n=1 Tax=Leuconostoc mesenteroides TaxID=1245 RepID=UPI003081158C
MAQKMIYFSFMFGVWLVYVGSMFPIFLLSIFLLFKSLGQSLHVAMIVASVLTFLFIIVQRTFRGLHLINQIQKNI